MRHLSMSVICTVSLLGWGARWLHVLAVAIVLATCTHCIVLFWGAAVQEEEAVQLFPLQWVQELAHTVGVPVTVPDDDALHEHVCRAVVAEMRHRWGSDIVDNINTSLHENNMPVLQRWSADQVVGAFVLGTPSDGRLGFIDGPAGAGKSLLVEALQLIRSHTDPAVSALQ